MMMEGLSNKEIALHLKISAHTVKFHISSIWASLARPAAPRRLRLVFGED
jgi:DNA-binding CsgD family transcriptional regulator